MNKTQRIANVVERVNAYMHDAYVVKSSSSCRNKCETTCVAYMTCRNETIRVVATFVDDAFSYMTIIHDDDEFYVE